MRKKFSKNTTQVFAKTIFHYVPNILKYIDEIKEPRKIVKYSMRYLIFSEMLMFLSEGKSQRFTETAYAETKYLENIGKLINEKIGKIPDAEIYTNVFSRIEKEEIEKFHHKINYKLLRNKVFENSKILGKYNIALDATRFQKAHYKVSDEWLSETIEDKTTWYLSMLELKLIANGMAVSLGSEMIKNNDKIEDMNRHKSREEVKQDCELNASKRLLPKLKKMYPRLPLRIIADSLYPSKSLIELCEEEEIEYIFVLKDKKIPTLLEEFMTLVSLKDGNRELKENDEKIILILWENDIDYKGNKVNIIREITKNKITGKYSKWMWMTNRKITSKNVTKIIECAKLRDYIENQGFREQKVTSGIDLEHVYSKSINAINVIYTIIQLVHLILQIIEHSDICGNFNKNYGSIKVFSRKFYAHITLENIDMTEIDIKIQIRFIVSI